MEQSTIIESCEFLFGQHSDEWSNQAGIYIFAGLNLDRKWTPIVVGQCDSFADSIPLHSLWATAKKQGATHVLYRPTPLKHDRDRIENILITKYADLVILQEGQKKE